MKKFKFKLAGLLTLRNQQIKLAEIAYIKALNIVREEEKVLYNMYEGLELSFATSSEIKLADPKPSPKLDIIDDYQKGAKLKIQEQSDKVRRKKQILEKANDNLKFAEKEKKVLLKVEEKDRDLHKKEVAKKTQKNIDDIVVTRYARKNGSFES